MKTFFGDGKVMEEDGEVLNFHPIPHHDHGEISQTNWAPLCPVMEGTAKMTRKVPAPFRG